MFDKEELSCKLEKIRLETNVAGMNVAVTDNEKIIYSEGFGVENILRPEVKTSKDALYKIASVSKTVTAIMILCLCQEKILDIDTPLCEYVPHLKFSNPKALEQMTLRHLLKHTAGMPKDIFLEEGSRDEETILPVIEKLLPDIELSSMPCEEKYSYSTWGYSVIGYVASFVTKKPISQLLNEYVLEPLGMDMTTFDYQVASTYPLSLPHIKSSQNEFKVSHYQRINTLYYAGGGLYSNTDDLCKLARFFMNNGYSDSKKEILTGESFSELIAKRHEQVDAKGDFYGLGVMLHKFKDGFVLGHTGGYNPYVSSVFVDKKTNIGVATMFNTNVTKAHMDITEQIFELFR